MKCIMDMLRDLLVKTSADDSEMSLELQEEICIGHKYLGVMNEPLQLKLRFHGALGAPV